MKNNKDDRVLILSSGKTLYDEQLLQHSQEDGVFTLWPPSYGPSEIISKNIPKYSPINNKK